MGKCEPAAHIERVRVGNPPPKVARAALLPDDPVFSFIEYCQDLFDGLPGRRGLGDRLVRSSSQVAHTVWMRQPKERRQFAQRGGRAAVS